MATLVTVAIIVTSLESDPIRSRLHANLGWDHGKGFEFNLYVIVDAGL